MSSDEPQDVRLELASKIFLCKAKDVTGVDKAKLQSEVLEVVYKEEMSHVYERVCSELGLPADAARLAAMKAANASKLSELEAKIKDAEENLGETEVRDAMQARADFLAKVGDVAGATEAYAATEKQTASPGLKVDMVLSQIRMHILFGDWPAVKRCLARAQQLCDAGGDWEHKNRLAVYRALLSLACRDFSGGAKLLLDSIATFAASELFPYSQCIFYAVLTSLVTLDRVALKSKVVDSPEILTVIGQMPALASMLTSLHACRYAEFFRAFPEVMDAFRKDLYLAPHLRYYMRELRLVAYGQFLESYKSCTLGGMAAAFGVSPAFLDEELAEFIVQGRLPAKIDKVGGIIETHRPDAKNALYQEAIRKGDLLLNRVQKLSKVIDIEAAGSKVLDLGCSPGAWLQVACQEIGPREKGGLVVGIDLQAVTVPDKFCDDRVKVMQADARTLKPEDLIQHTLDGFDTVLSDMLHFTSGVNDVELSLDLAGTAMNIATGHYFDLYGEQYAQQVGFSHTGFLRPGGALVMKIYEGSGTDAFMKDMQKYFNKTVRMRVEASRSMSREFYAVGLGRKKAKAPPR